MVDTKNYTIELLSLLPILLEVNDLTLNDKYIHAKTEKRATLLVSTIRKLINLNNEYYDMESDIKNMLERII